MKLYEEERRHRKTLQKQKERSLLSDEAHDKRNARQRKRNAFIKHHRPAVYARQLALVRARVARLRENNHVAEESYIDSDDYTSCDSSAENI